MTYIVLTKWIMRTASIGTVREPALLTESGVTSWLDLTGQLAANIVANQYLLCKVECEPEVAGRIESNGLGVVLWESDSGLFDDAKVNDLTAKLINYGVPAEAITRVEAGKKLTTIQAQLNALLKAQ